MIQLMMPMSRLLGDFGGSQLMIARKIVNDFSNLVPIVDNSFLSCR